MSKFLFYFSDWNANSDRRMEDTYGGVGYYRIAKVAEQIKRNPNCTVDIVGVGLTKKDETVSDRWERIFTDYDVFWCCYSSHSEDASAMYYWRDKLGKKVVMDLDDNFWDVLPTNPLYDTLKEGKKDRAFISTILSFADIITVSTEPLKQKVEEHMKNVFGLDKTVIVIPNMNDVNDWKGHRAKKLDPNKIVVGYAGSNSHQDDIAMVNKVMVKLMDKYPNLHYQLMGSVKASEIGMFKDFSKDAMMRIDLINASSTFNMYPKRMSECRWDIVIAPLVDSKFTRCKSHIKFMEYAMHKRPVIASRVYPYFMELKGREVITDEVNGLLVEPNEWERALEDLIHNPEKRKRLGENAYNHIVKNWQYKDSNIQDIVDIIISVPESQK